MRIVHICLCDPYDEDWAYHRNIISEQNKRDGHDTYIITNAYVMNKRGLNGEMKIGREVNKYGIVVYRLPNKWPILPKSVQSKVCTSGLVYETLEEISPDIIMVHNVQTFNLTDIVRYRKLHDVLLLGDSHASLANSCRNVFSRYFVQGTVFRLVINRHLKDFDSFYFIGVNEYDFFINVYKIYLDNYNILPLPARFFERINRDEKRNLICKELNVPNDCPIFVHSGKLVKAKRTKELLEALHYIDEQFTLLIIGNIPKENAEIFDQINNDCRFFFLGWKTSNEISEYLSIADLYLQPGTPSVTLQNSLAVGTPALVNENSGYQDYYSGWEYEVRDDSDIYAKLVGIFKHIGELKDKRTHAYSTAREYFDCEVFANEMYNLRLSDSYYESVKKREGRTIVSRKIVCAIENSR